MNKANHTTPTDEESTLREEAGLNLTPKQRGFVEYYIETGSAPDAAMLAYDCTSRASARVLAHRNLNNPKVQAFLAHFLLEHSHALVQLKAGKIIGRAVINPKKK